MKPSHIRALIGKDLLIEWRHMAALGGLILYLVSTVFVVYLSFQGMVSPQAWNSLFWVILLFANLNAVLKGFLQEHEKRGLYYYSLVSPRELITARILYNGLLMSLLGVAAFVVFTAFLGNPVKSPLLFWVNLILGSVALSSVLTLVSAIASGARNNFTLMGVLSFPLILPLLLMLIRVSQSALAGAALTQELMNLLAIGLLMMVTFVLSYVLFPYIWTE